MMIFNPKKAIRLVDDGSTVHSDRVHAPLDRAILREQERRNIHRMNQIRAARANEQRRLEHVAALKSQRDAAMLRRSLHQTEEAGVRARGRHSFGHVPTYGVNNPHMGFVDEVPESDFTKDQAIPAQEFSNRLSSKDFRGYTKFKDYPLVIDAPAGDFGGVTLNERGSADYSTMIVNDVKQDFGSLPRRRR